MTTTNKILLVRPTGFGFNEQTALSNTFQNRMDDSAEMIRKKSLREFEEFDKRLRENGIDTFVFEDKEPPAKPDAVFPNNWISMHEDGAMVLYPMCAPNRRIERSKVLIDKLRKTFKITRVLDFTAYENENRFLEGTGSIIFDHQNRVAYACLSPRTDEKLFPEVCEELKYKPIAFHSVDENNIPVYHTNVMMCVAPEFAVICLESINDPDEKPMVIRSLESTGKEVVAIGFSQMNAFAGNMLAVKNRYGQQLLAMSKSAYDCLTSDQKSTLEKYCQLLPFDVKTIETLEGGSVRCMMAEIFSPYNENYNPKGDW